MTVTLKREPQVAAEFYRNGYDQKERMASYWHQIHEVMAFSPRTVIEVGSGSGLVRRALEANAVTVTSVDIDPHLHPDVVASVEQVPLPDKCADVVLCCEVLEHLPFDRLDICLAELGRLAVKGVVISLPDVERYLAIHVCSTSICAIRYFKELPRRAWRRPKHLTCDQHFWEIGATGYPLRIVLNALKQHYRGDIRTYRVFENPYHRMFVVDYDGSNLSRPRNP